MGGFSFWDTGWPEAFAAILAVSLVGKFLGNETRILTMALIGAVITGSWEGIAISIFVALITKSIDVVRGLS
jgi:hypothetical protein